MGRLQGGKGCLQGGTGRLQGTAWGYAWPAHTNAKSAFQSSTIEKNAKRDTLIAVIRKIANAVQANQAVTDAQKEALGVTVRKTGRTPSPIPTTPPSMQRIDTSTRAILRLFFVDSTTPDSRSKPPGVASCEIREQVGGTAPTDPEAMSLLAIETRMPYRADFEAGDIGKTAYFAMRWLNTRGKPGPGAKSTARSCRARDFEPACYKRARPLPRGGGRVLFSPSAGKHPQSVRPE